MLLGLSLFLLIGTVFIGEKLVTNDTPKYYILQFYKVLKKGDYLAYTDLMEGNVQLSRDTFNSWHLEMESGLMKKGKIEGEISLGDDLLIVYDQNNIHHVFQKNSKKYDYLGVDVADYPINFNHVDLSNSKSRAKLYDKELSVEEGIEILSEYMQKGMLSNAPETIFSSYFTGLSPDENSQLREDISYNSMLFSIEMNQYEKALEYADKAFNASDTHVTHKYFWEAYIYFKMNKPASALYRYQTNIKQNDGTKDAQLYMAIMYSKTWEEAQEKFNRIAEKLYTFNYKPLSEYVHVLGKQIESVPVSTTNHSPLSDYSHLASNDEREEYLVHFFGERYDVKKEDIIGLYIDLTNDGSNELILASKRYFADYMSGDSIENEYLSVFDLNSGMEIQTINDIQSYTLLEIFPVKNKDYGNTLGIRTGNRGSTTHIYALKGTEMFIIGSIYSESDFIQIVDTDNDGYDEFITAVIDYDQEFSSMAEAPYKDILYYWDSKDYISTEVTIDDGSETSRTGTGNTELSYHTGQNVEGYWYSEEYGQYNFFFKEGHELVRHSNYGEGTWEDRYEINTESPQQIETTMYGYTDKTYYIVFSINDDGTLSMVYDNNPPAYFTRVTQEEYERFIKENSSYGE